MESKVQTNIEAYRSDEAIEKYSNYTLYPNEKYLFKKYFKSDKSILDLACGGGRTTLRLYEMGYTRIKGVDLSDVLVDLAQKRFPAIQFEVGSYCDIQETNESYDNVLLSHNGIDHAFPETEREKAISECARVLRPGGYFVMSSHNIKSLYGSPFYYKQRKWWLLKNMWRAPFSRAYVYDLKSWMFYGSPNYCIQQIEKHGFKLVESIGFRGMTNPVMNKWLSPYIHYVFQKR